MSAAERIAHHCPRAGPEERALRLRIANAQSLCQAHAATEQNGRPRALFWIAAQMAGDWIFRQGVTVEQLDYAVELLLDYVTLANRARAFEGPDDE